MRIFKAIGLLLALSLATHTSWAFDDAHILKGTTLPYPPYQFEQDGQPTGLAVEILTEAVKRTGIAGVDFAFFPWKRAVFSIENGPKEVLFNAGKNKARQVWGHYSQHTLILQKYYLFARTGSVFETDLSFNNLKEKSIAVRAGYLYGSGPFKKALTTPDTFAQIAETNSTAQSVRLLLNGRVDMFVGDFLPVMHYLIENNLAGQVRLVKKKETDEDLIVLTWPTYFLFSKRNVPESYFSRFDTALASMIEDGSYQAIQDKYTSRYQLPSAP